jgi:hypothetical protein
MRCTITSRIMARTTVDIDDPVLKDLKRLQREEKKPLGRLISDLLAEALSRQRTKPARHVFRWHAQDMRPLIDVSDKAAVQAVFDADDLEKLRR